MTLTSCFYKFSYTQTFHGRTFKSFHEIVCSCIIPYKTPGSKFDLAVKNQEPPKDILLTILVHVVFLYPMLHTKFQDHRSIVLENIFKVLFTIYGRDRRVGRMKQTVLTISQTRVFC